MAGGILIATISLAPSLFENKAEASTYSQSAPVQQEYVVQPGDSLFLIAKKFNTTVNDLKQINKLTSNTIYVGQTLKLTEKTTVAPKETQQPVQTTHTYSVKSGDSLFKIAQRFNTTVDSLKKANILTTNTIYVGQKIKIPSTTTGTEQTPVKDETPTKPVQSPDHVETTTYTVVSGDALSLIAKRFNTTNHAIKSANELKSDTIYVGQKLQIPGTK